MQLPHRRDPLLHDGDQQSLRAAHALLPARAVYGTPRWPRHRQADRERAVQYVEDVYAKVYDEPVAFRAYADKTLQDFLVVTVFTGEGGAFGPPSGLADPQAQGLERATTELVREDDAVCVASYQAVPQGQDASAPPLAVTCQLAADGHTVQLTSNGHSVDDTVALTHDVAERV